MNKGTGSFQGNVGYVLRGRKDITPGTPPKGSFSNSGWHPDDNKVRHFLRRTPSTVCKSFLQCPGDVFQTQDGCSWETFYMFAYCGLVWKSPLNCKSNFFCSPSNVNQGWPPPSSVRLSQISCLVPAWFRKLRTSWTFEHVNRF